MVTKLSSLGIRGVLDFWRVFQKIRKRQKAHIRIRQRQQLGVSYELTVSRFYQMLLEVYAVIIHKVNLIQAFYIWMIKAK